MVIGVIPATRNDALFPLPIELMPVDYQVVDGVRQFRPLAQLIVDGMNNATVDEIVFVINDRKMDLMRFFGNGALDIGMGTGVPISYIYSPSTSIAVAINACYHRTRNATVLMGIPGITNPTLMKSILTTHMKSEVPLTLSVSNNTRVDQEQNIRSVTLKQMSGIFAWGPAFTEILRDIVVGTKDMDLDYVIGRAIGRGMRAHAIKLPHATFVNDATTWSKTIRFVKAKETLRVKKLDDLD